MRIFRDHSGASAGWTGGALALGNFDGVHRGHQAVIRDAGRAAKDAGVPFGVVCFEPHPRSLLRPDGPKFRLTTPRTKARLIGELGADALFMLRFRRAFARLDGREFVKHVLVDGLRAAHVSVGYDFRFGHDRVDDVHTLAAMGAEFGFSVSAVGPVKDSAEALPFSSTLARDHLRQGRPRQAAGLLGHWWTVEGHVRGGDRRGRTIGFPTCNLPLGDLIEPQLGVYAVRVAWRGAAGLEQRDGVANIGRRPTFDKRDVLLEAHLFDFAGDLYGRPICVSLVEFIRPERRFDGLDSLKAQIAADSDAARRLLADPRNQAAPLDGMAAAATAPAAGA